MVAGLRPPLRFPLASRRDFLRAAAAVVAVAVPVLAGACDDGPTDPGAAAALDDRTDTGLMNALYALAQLESDWYARVGLAPFPGMTQVERAVLRDIGGHTAKHVAYLANAIPGRRIGDLLELDFSAVNLADRASVLGTSRSFEDLVVAAYNGALTRLTDAALLAGVAKIASVKARHAAAVRDLIDTQPGAPRSGTLFADADVVDPATGLEREQGPAAAVDTIRAFFRTPLTIRS